jgi:hypothetical protein
MPPQLRVRGLWRSAYNGILDLLGLWINLVTVVLGSEQMLG